MKENTNIRKEDEKKVWHHIQQGLLKLPRFASGVSEKQCKKKLGIVQDFQNREREVENATGNLLEEYEAYERDMVQIMKEYEPKRQSQEDAKAVEAARLARVLQDLAVWPETPPCGVAVIVVRLTMVRNPKSPLDSVGHQQPPSRYRPEHLFFYGWHLRTLEHD
jgi:hypothetical protein